MRSKGTHDFCLASSCYLVTGGVWHSHYRIDTTVG